MASNNKNYMLNDKFPKQIKNATSTSDGLMSSEDKARLDELFEFGLLSPATPDKDGVMTKEDKMKLDGVENGANNYIHPNTPEIRHVTDDQIEKWNSQVFYTNDIPTTISLGGIEKGETFDNVSYDEMFDRLLHPYIYPQLSSISVTPPTTVLEKGYTFNINNIYFKTDTPSLPNDKPIHYDFKANGDIFRSIDKTDRTVNVVVSHTIKDNTTISVTLIDNINNKEKTFNLITYNFVYPLYYGIMSDSDNITASLVNYKTKLIETKGNKTLKFTTNNEKILFAYPKIYGELKAIYDANNFNILNTFTRNEITMTGLDNNTVSYYVYTNDVSTVTDYNIKFNFS